MGVAQLVERRTVAPNVAGSNPVSHPNFRYGFRPATRHISRPRSHSGHLCKLHLLARNTYHDELPNLDLRASGRIAFRTTIRANCHRDFQVVFHFAIKLNRGCRGRTRDARRAALASWRCLPPQTKCCLLRRLLSAKKYLHVVLFEDRIRSQQGHRFRAGLRDEHAVEGVSMELRQLAGSQRMEMSDIQ